jgi:CoA-transferase family III
VDERGRAWAASGAMELTGRPDGPGLGGPAALVDLVAQAADVLDRRSNGRAAVDGLPLLGERAALSNLTRHGTISCGGSTRLVRAADEGWLAVSLARPEDIAALGAWLCADVPDGDPWPAVERMVAESDAATLDERAALLGLPIAALSSVEPPAFPAFGLPIGASCLEEAGGPPRPIEPRPIEGALVVDLSSLWAGPLCGQLLATAGADVVKVESLARPDGARQGPAAFFDLMNGPKRSVALDLATSGGRRDLRRLIGAADVVIESARPRALEQMGIAAAEELRRPAGPQVWASITSHGRGPGQAERVAFGDVAAVAGGLVARDEQGPCFLADAVADPLCGLVAAAGILEALAAGGRWLLSVALAPLAAAVAGPGLVVDAAAPASPPRARAAVCPARPLGADTAAVLGGLAW